MENELCVMAIAGGRGRLINDRTPTLNNLPKRWGHTLLIKQLDYTYKRTIKWQFIVTFGWDRDEWWFIKVVYCRSYNYRSEFNRIVDYDKIIIYAVKFLKSYSDFII